MRKYLTAFSLICINTFAAFSQQPIKFTEFDLHSSGSSNPDNYTVIGSNLVFSATHNSLGNELWSSNGTVAGTALLKDIKNGSASSSPLYFAELNGKVIFAADNGVNGNEIYITDGTTGGTSLLMDIIPVSVPSNPMNFFKYNSKIYFTADTFLKGREIWVTDGTTAGTNILLDLNPGPATCDYANPCIYNSRLYFTANEGINGTEPWSTDGTDTGTHILKNLVSGSSFPKNFLVSNGKLYFVATTPGMPPTTHLYTTDGTAANTNKVSNSIQFQNDFIASYNNMVYFNGGDPAGPELYKTDGTSAGTTLVKEFFPGAAGTSISPATVVYKNMLYFVPEAPGYGKELWVTDGTTAGTKMVKDILAGVNGSDPGNFKIYKNYLYFTAQDTLNNYQVFRTDGTDTGTHMIRPANATVSSPVSTTNGFKGFTEFNGALYYTATYTTSGTEMWSLQDTSISIHVKNATLNPKNINIYPNPSNGSFTVSFSGNMMNGKVELYDITGRNVYSKPVNNQSEIKLDVAYLTKGIYYLQLKNGSDTITKKLVIN